MVTVFNVLRWSIIYANLFRITINSLSDADQPLYTFIDLMLFTNKPDLGWNSGPPSSCRMKKYVKLKMLM